MMVRTPDTVQTQRSRLFRLFGQDVAAPLLPPGLYLVATPIGNLSDVTLRALETLAAVEAIALVSDAGTPLISDPGFKLVQAAQTAGHAVTAIPGASAVLAALTACCLPTDRFFFEGFLPPREAARRTRIDELADLPATLVFFETGPRIAAMLDDVAARLGGRQAAVCRELTKLHEEIRRGEVAALALAYRDGAETRGEFV